MTFSAMVVGRSPGPRAKIRLVAPRGMMLTSPRGVQWRAHQPARRGRASCRAVSVTRIAPQDSMFANDAIMPSGGN
jgi:hypothetical protein